NIYSFNTMGCIAGSFISGFILIPLIGLKWSIILAASLNITIAVILALILIHNNKHKYITIILNLLLILLFIFKPACWNNQFITIGNFINKKNIIINNPDVLDKENLLFYKEGQHATISVRKLYDSEHKIDYALYNNGKVDATTRLSDMRTQVSLGYVPCMLANKLNNVLIVGMGSGITASAVLKFPVNTVEMVELEEAVIEASKFLSINYGDPLQDKRFKIIIDDARNYLRVTNKKYDLIISEPSNVWISGVASLFTKEYYKAIKNKLTSDGILCQWVHIYLIKSDRIISVIKAIKSEFKYVYLCHTKTGSDLLLIASNKPININLDLIEKRMNYNHVRKDLLEIFNISNHYQFLSFFISNNDGVEKILSEKFKTVPVNTDNNSYLEFKSVKDFFIEPSEEKTFSTDKLAALFKGISKENVINPPDNFYKVLINNIEKQYQRAKILKEPLENREIPVYKELIKVYSSKE
ncbi:MAG: hypothetical protein AB1782_20570, partial [Cyanobacteriota bacterium]